MKGKSHGGKGGGWDSRDEHQAAKTCILRQRLYCLNPSLRLAKISRPWDSDRNPSPKVADTYTLAERPAAGERRAGLEPICLCFFSQNPAGIPHH